MIIYKNSIAGLLYITRTSDGPSYAGCASRLCSKGSDYQESITSLGRRVQVLYMGKVRLLLLENGLDKYTRMAGGYPQSTNKSHETTDGYAVMEKT